MSNIIDFSTLRKPIRFKRKRTEYTRKVNSTIRNLIKILNLEEIESHDDRMKILLYYFKSKNLSKNTVDKYILDARALGLVNKSTLTYVPYTFDYKKQTRIINPSLFGSFIEKCIKKPSKDTSVFTFAFFTGLRYFELKQISAITITQLLNRDPKTHIKRKSTYKDVYWEPIYSETFNYYIKYIETMYLEEMELYRKRGVVRYFFDIPHSTLADRLHSYFYLYENQILPKGFGIHSFRGMLATTLFQGKTNLPTIQRVLQHKRIATTKRYVDPDSNKQFVEKFNNFLNVEFNELLQQQQ